MQNSNGGNFSFAIVIGNLGDLVKKLIELKMRSAEGGFSARPLVAEIAAYSVLLEDWPVENRETVESLTTLLHYQIARYKNLEKMLEDLTTDTVEDVWLGKTVKDYFQLRDGIKCTMGTLNMQGRGAGKPPRIKYEVSGNGSISDFSDGGVQCP